MDNPNQLLRMVRGAGLIVIALLFLFLVIWNFGCTTTEPVYERVEVPMPYWQPPDDIAPAPPRPRLQAGDLTREEVEADPRTALLALGQDLSAALSWGEQLAYLYDQLVILINTEPVLPPSDGSVSPSD